MDLYVRLTFFHQISTWNGNVECIHIFYFHAFMFHLLEDLCTLLISSDLCIIETFTAAPARKERSYLEASKQHKLN